MSYNERLLGAERALAEIKPVRNAFPWMLVLGVVGGYVLMLWLATQYVAHRLGYQPDLGWAIFRLQGDADGHGFALYTPWDYLWWFAKYILYFDDPLIRYPFLEAGAGIVMVTFVGLLAYVMVANKKKPEPMKTSALHGSARFADFEGVQKSGLLKGSFETDPTEVAFLNWIANALVTNKMTPEAAKAKAKPLMDAIKEREDRLMDMAKRGEDYGPELFAFMKDKQWLKLHKRRLELLRACKQALVVGGFRNPETQGLMPLLDAGGRHVLAYAPTGSGKGVALMLPTLFTYQGSLIVHDVKRENYVLTAGFRKRVLGQKIILCEPLDETGQSARFNPLLSVRVGTLKEVTDVDTIGNIMTGAGGNKKSDPFFDNSARDLFRGAALHVLYAQDKAPNMGDVLSLLSSKPMEELCEELASFDHARGREFYWTKDERTGEAVSTHPNVRESFSRVLAAGDKTMGSIKATLESTLNFYADPVVRKNTSTSDFTINDLVNGDVPVSLYLVAPPTATEKTGPYFSILINLVLSRLTEAQSYVMGRANKLIKHELCFLLDEFPALATIESVPKALGYTRSYGLRFFLVCQDPGQLKSRYGEEGRDTIFANCHVRVAMTPNDLSTAKLISEYLGDTTLVQETQSFSGKKMALSLDGTSLSTQYHKRALASPAELMTMAEEKLVVFVAGANPVLAEKAKYYEDEVWSKWATLPPPKQTDKLSFVDNALDPEKFPKVRAERGPARAVPKVLRLEDIPVLDEDDEDAQNFLAGVQDVPRATAGGLASGAASWSDVFPDEPADERATGGDAGASSTAGSGLEYDDDFGSVSDEDLAQLDAVREEQGDNKKGSASSDPDDPLNFF